MTKQDIARKVAEKHKITIDQAVGIIDSVVNAIIVGVSQEGKVEVRGFGTWTARTRKARETTAPKTGAKHFLPERKVPFFKPAKSFHTTLNEEESAG